MRKEDGWAIPYVGKTLAGRYRLDRVIGAGGMGAVFEGHQLAIGKRVAVKLMHPQLAAAPSFLERFHREARSATAIGHPGVVQMFDFDVDPSCGAFLVMEYIEGQTLLARLSQGALPPVEAVPIALHILRTLGSVHEAGVVHRDLKPDNVFLTRDDRDEPTVKLLDFGVAMMRSAARETRLTVPGEAVGTPRWMSPEQARGSPVVDLRADLYAVGAILYSALSGTVPYADVESILVHQAVLEAPPAPLEHVAPGLSSALYAVVARAMAREADDRFASAHEMARALSEAAGRRVATAELPAFSARTLPDTPAARLAASGPASPADVAVASPPPRRRNRLYLFAWLALVPVALAAAIVGVAVFVVLQRVEPRAPAAPPDPSVRASLDEAHALAAAGDAARAEAAFVRVLDATGRTGPEAAEAYCGLGDLALAPLLQIPDDASLGHANLTVEQANQLLTIGGVHYNGAQSAHAASADCAMWRHGRALEKMSDVVSRLTPATAAPGDPAAAWTEASSESAASYRRTARETYAAGLEMPPGACREDLARAVRRLDR